MLNPKGAILATLISTVSFFATSFSQENFFDTNTIQHAVVQIFSQVAAFDWLEPYKTPEQYTTSGSGFIINEQGYIVTNAHVVDQAVALWVYMPALGKRLVDAQLVSFCPEHDLALLRLDESARQEIVEHFGKMPFLTIGNSDRLRRADAVITYGYPLPFGQGALKSTDGIYSGPESGLLQISAALNPGSSGGPLLNKKGEVVGINCSGILDAQSIGYAIPSNLLITLLPEMYKRPCIKRRSLGGSLQPITPYTFSYLGVSTADGCYIQEVLPGGPLDKAGVQAKDILVQIDGHAIDSYGEITLEGYDEKRALSEYIERVPFGTSIELLVCRGECTFICSLMPQEVVDNSFRTMYPAYEKIDYEVFGGMVLMQLMQNNYELLVGDAPGLERLYMTKNNTQSLLVITHIFPNSELNRCGLLMPGDCMQMVNNEPVSTLADFRAALKKQRANDYFALTVADMKTDESHTLLVVLPMAKLLEENRLLSEQYHFDNSGGYREKTA